MNTFRILIVALLLCPFLAQSRDYNKYLSLVNKAEAMIVDDEYEKACLYYDSALKVWDKPFAIDLYNYLKCANFSKQYNRVKVAADMLVSLGCDMQFFLKPSCLAEFRTSVYWSEFYKGYPQRKLKFIEHNDWKTRLLIERIEAQDQFYRAQDPVYSFLKDSTYNNDDSIRVLLSEMFKTKFPNEYDYGVFLENDTTLLAYEPLHLVLLHNYGKFDTSELPNANVKTHDYTEFLLKSVKQGQMHPQEFAYLNERSGDFMKGKGYRQAGGFLVKIDGKMYFNNYAQEDEIDINRTQLGLISYDEEKKKAIYMIQHKNRFILFKHMGYVVRMNNLGIPQNVMNIMYKDANITEQ